MPSLSVCSYLTAPVPAPDVKLDFFNFLTLSCSLCRDAFSHVQERRFCINPNVGFVHQLQVQPRVDPRLQDTLVLTDSQLLVFTVYYSNGCFSLRNMKRSIWPNWPSKWWHPCSWADPSYKPGCQVRSSCFYSCTFIGFPSCQCYWSSSRNFREAEKGKQVVLEFF